MSFACVSTKIAYNYNHVSYESPERALSAQKANCDLLLSTITPTTNPVGGVAVFISPSIKYIKENICSYKGPAISNEMKNQTFDWNAKSLLDSYRCMSESIEKRRIFDRVIFTSCDNPERATFSENIAILLFKKDVNIQYFIKRKSNPDYFIPIEEISTAFPPIQGLTIWLNNIETAARIK